MDVLTCNGNLPHDLTLDIRITRPEPDGVFKASRDGSDVSALLQRGYTGLITGNYCCHRKLSSRAFEQAGMETHRLPVETPSYQSKIAHLREKIGWLQSLVRMGETNDEIECEVQALVQPMIDAFGDWLRMNSSNLKEDSYGLPVEAYIRYSYLSTESRRRALLTFPRNRKNEIIAQVSKELRMPMEEFGILIRGILGQFEVFLRTIKSSIH